MRPGSGAIEDFATLLDPYTLLLREELNFAERRNASYSKQVGPETITLTVEAPAEGDFSNDYLSGTSIDESDTRREYRFDRTTGRLIGLKIEQTDGKTPVTIAELQRIVYDIPLSDTLFRAYDASNGSTSPNRSAAYTSQPSHRKRRPAHSSPPCRRGIRKYSPKDSFSIRSTL